ncbi:gadd45gip1 [Trichonephila inaurata madagascariensis]|uniref:Large ribosomal subunit protein mL64 n=1 Tax=Trichonephila inaurata madagascariensis TaxID=2747483 RepID=A0A8X6XNQ4_9ARAC|nr:gadd45gip1 [Trichonephila inaurata madagascariensis]
MWKFSLVSPNRLTVTRCSLWLTRRFGTSFSKLSTVKTEEKVDEVKDILNDLKEPELSEDEILRKQFKARLPERLYRKHVLKEAVPIETKYDLQKYRLRNHYGRFGKASKLNPGLCWPTREEILETIKYDRMFEPSLQERIENVKAAQLVKDQRRKEIDDEVEKNMANLDKWIADYHAKIEKKNAKAQELKLQRERLVEEISEYLGYDIDPRDPRFKEAVEQRDKEKKKALKAKKQQESYDKMLEKLRKIAQSN